MNIPTYINVQYTEESGFLTSQIQLYTDELNQALQNGLSDNGWTVPNQSAANITSVSATMPDGSMWYDTDGHKMVFKLNGALFTFTPVAWP